MRRWTLQIWKRDIKKDRVYTAQVTVTLPIETIAEAFELLHEAGFACLRKVDGNIVPNGNIQMRLSSESLKELLDAVIEDTVKIRKLYR